MIKLLVVTLCFGSCLGYKHYQDEIPNGHQIPNPCEPGTIWQGVGHEDHKGGGPRNSFGSDFMQANKRWTTELCRKDSDGDGRTNGEEVGDPNCVWLKGTDPAVTDPKQLSHPGLCEPITSAECQAHNSFLKECAALSLTTPSTIDWCPALAQPDVKTFEMSYNATHLSDEETIYMCESFQLPADDDYEIIAWEPIIDNREILHHMVLFACENPSVADFIESLPNDRPVNCRMIPPCGSMIVVWAYGIDGQCYSNSYGAPFGKNFYKTVLLQMHYNNEARKPGYIDSSGIKLHYQPKRRLQEKGMLAFGEMYLVVPPRTPYVEATGVISSECTQKILQPHQQYYLTGLLFHVHELGSFGRITIKKKKAGYEVVIINKNVTYDRPEVAHWQSPYEILLEPGDEVTVTCGFSSMMQSDWTFFGSQTADEMCYAFMDIFPRPRNRYFEMPAGTGTVSYCESWGEPNATSWTIRGCAYYTFYDKMQLQFGVPVEKSNATMELMEACVCWGSANYPAPSCSSACYGVMDKYSLFDDPCTAEDSIWQIGMRPFYDDSEILHRTHSQIAKCQTLSQPPPIGQTCERELESSANRGNNNFFAMLIMLAATIVSISM